ncbi:methyl-accepting chemotaxis protein [Geotalea sp. SG265]|uniref:methyl-accepting chemotaxis protein n=1 Tax=Geotalea sp. SG265 TaxID=2922867 RepID=UPI001FAF58DE|nr:methyl-accepting chemotaxis protein [Geotalea sp. SG265]
MSLKDLNIGTRLSLGFGLVLLLLLAVSGVGYWGSVKIAETSEGIIGTEAKIGEFYARARANMLFLRIYEKDCFINIQDVKRREEYYKQWNEKKERLKLWFAELEKISLSPQDRNTVKLIQGEMAKYEEGYTKVFADIANGTIKTTEEANRAILPYKDAAHRMQEQTSDASKDAFDDIHQKEKEIHALDERIGKTIIVFPLVAIIAAIVITFLIRQSIVKPIREINIMLNDIACGEGDLTKRLMIASNDEIGAVGKSFNLFMEKLHGIINQVVQNSTQVASAANQLYATSEQMATGAEEVAAQSGTVATASEEMAATSGEIAQNCTYAAAGAQQASESATAGAAVVDNTVSVMGRIAERVKTSSRTVESLGDRGEQIGAIIGTIEDIADQTNLLALNAAIEAARAGEQGRGFAVVADEVRALAERTTKATREIGTMIKAIQTETKDAVNAMEEGVREVESGTAEAARSGEAIQDILNQIGAVTMQVNQIATAAEEQTATTSEINNNMQQITEVVQGTARGAQESAAAASKVADLAEGLNRLVGQFKL